MPAAGWGLRAGSYTGLVFWATTIVTAPLVQSPSAPPHRVPTPPPVVVDRLRFTTTVSASGVGRGSRGVESGRLAVGTYVVRLPVPVATCVTAAGIGEPLANRPLAQSVTAVARPNVPDELLITLVDADGRPCDSGFSVQIGCR